MPGIIISNGDADDYLSSRFVPRKPTPLPQTPPETIAQKVEKVLCACHLKDKPVFNRQEPVNLEVTHISEQEIEKLNSPWRDYGRGIWIRRKMSPIHYPEGVGARSCVYTTYIKEMPTVSQFIPPTVSAPKKAKCVESRGRYSSIFEE